MTMNEDEWITVEEAAELLRLTTRATHHYHETGRLRTMKAGNRRMYFRADVEQLAQELNVAKKPRPQKPKFEMISTPEFLAYMREKDKKIEELQERLHQAAIRIGQLEGELKSGQRLLEDHERLRTELDFYKQSYHEMVRRLSDIETDGTDEKQG